MGLGERGDMGGVVIEVSIFLAIVAYFWNRDKRGQMDGQAAEKNKKAIALMTLFLR